MWNVILQRLGGRYAAYVTLPIAIIVGSIGYYIEQKVSKRRPEISYLEKGLNEQRMSRQLNEEGKPEFQRYDDLATERQKIVPQSLLVNTGRSGKSSSQ